MVLRAARRDGAGEFDRYAGERPGLLPVTEHRISDSSRGGAGAARRRGVDEEPQFPARLRIAVPALSRRLDPAPLPGARLRLRGTMFEGWSEYFFMVGSSAAALIGLMFVVVTLTAGRDRAEVEGGKHLYTSPIVWHLAPVLPVGGAAIVPAISSGTFAILAGGLALIGMAIGIR